VTASTNVQYGAPVIGLDADRRGLFISRTYSHLFGAILAFTALEVYLFSLDSVTNIARTLGGNWMIVLGAFMLISWLTSRVVHTVKSQTAQYLALGVFIIAEALIFVPILLTAQTYAPGVIQSAAMVTLVGFAGLTAIVFYTRKDFSFLSTVLFWGGIVAVVLIFASLIFGFNLGTFFSVAMIALAGGAILNDTSNVLHHYSEDRYIAAALQLFASVAMMFWYVLRLLMAFSRD